MPGKGSYEKKPLSSDADMSAAQNVSSGDLSGGRSSVVQARNSGEPMGDGPEHTLPGSMSSPSVKVGNSLVSSSAPNNMDIQDNVVRALREEVNNATPQHFQLDGDDSSSNSNGSSVGSHENSLSPVYGTSSVDGTVPTEQGCDSTNSEYSGWDKLSATHSPQHGRTLRSGASGAASHQSCGSSFAWLSSAKDDGSSNGSKSSVGANLDVGNALSDTSSLKGGDHLGELPTCDEKVIVKQSSSVGLSSQTPVDGGLAKGGSANSKNFLPLNIK